jgi:hypothetical protein
MSINTLIKSFALCVAIAITLGACAEYQVHSTARDSVISLEPGQLEAHGIAFITPSTVTGQEEDKQTLASIFAEVLETERPGIQIVSLPKTLSAINTAGIADEYRQMYIDYQYTGIFKRELINSVGKVTGVRYLAQLKLSNFEQNSKGRFSALGLRMFQTNQANIRLFLQIWDSHKGTIAWEGTDEVNYSWETSTEKPVTFRVIVEETAGNLVGKLP